MLVADLLGVLGRQIVHLDADALHRRLGRFRQVRLTLTFQMGKSLLKVVVRGAHCPPQPLERVFYVPFHDLSAL